MKNIPKPPELKDVWSYVFHDQQWILVLYMTILITILDIYHS